MPNVYVDQCEIEKSVIPIFMAITAKAVTCILCTIFHIVKATLFRIDGHRYGHKILDKVFKAHPSHAYDKKVPA